MQALPRRLARAAVLALFGAGSLAQAHSPAPATAAASKPAAAARPVVTRAAETRPSWNELTPPQRAALQPLAAQWSTISEAQKRKWLALSRNFGEMKPEEQGKLHSRMNEWVALSPQQRTQARLNFAEAKSLSPDDRRAKWEAYQALPAEEKRKLAAGAQPKAPATAAAIRPVPAQKLANVPRADSQRGGPRIAAGQPHDASAAPFPPAQSN